MNESKPKTKTKIRTVFASPKTPKRTMSDLSDAQVQRPRLWPLDDPFHPSNSSAYSTDTSADNMDHGDSEGESSDSINNLEETNEALEADAAEKMRLKALRRYWKSLVLDHLFACNLSIYIC